MSRRTVVWFSCGAASAVAAKLMLSRAQAGDEIAIARCVIANEHEDNDRFAADCERWFGQKIVNLTSAKYADCWEVWEDRRYISGIKGAPCTVEMKKAVRWAFEQSWGPQFQAFGYTAEERDRAASFRAQNPDVRLLTPLIEQGLGKADCLGMIERAGIELPAMYKLGFRNNNCIACAKAQSPEYGNRTRRHFPAEFARMAELSRRLGVRLIKLPTGERERIFLDELSPAMDSGEREPDIECSLLCVLAEGQIAAAT